MDPWIQVVPSPAPLLRVPRVWYFVVAYDVDPVFDDPMLAAEPVGQLHQGIQHRRSEGIRIGAMPLEFDSDAACVVLCVASVPGGVCVKDVLCDVSVNADPVVGGSPSVRRGKPDPRRLEPAFHDVDHQRVDAVAAAAGVVAEGCGHMPDGPHVPTGAFLQKQERSLWFSHRSGSPRSPCAQWSAHRSYGVGSGTQRVGACAVAQPRSASAKSTLMVALSLMRWVAMALLVGCGGGGADEHNYTGWAGFISTPDGSYGAFLFLGDTPDAGVYTARAEGLSGEVTGLPPHLTVHPDNCDAGFDATVELNGDAAVFSYSKATCAAEPSGSGTLWKWYERIP
jgi:hypothetical protein